MAEFYRGCGPGSFLVARCRGSLVSLLVVAVLGVLVLGLKASFELVLEKE